MKRLFRKLLGDRGEDAASQYLRRKGYRILAHSYRNQFGEIDLIAQDNRKIVFVEVKTRSSTRSGQPYDAVDYRKQKKLTQLATYWLRRHRRMHQAARFDVLSLLWPENAASPQITHIENAFDAVD